MGSDYVAKAIDLDISLFKNSLLLKLKQSRLFNEVVCSRDSDCNFNSLCLGQCDLAAGKCTESLKSNNLMVSKVCGEAVSASCMTMSGCQCIPT